MGDKPKNSPNYWCKHCKTFVRDTAFEKRNHEASMRHQGALQRFVKDLHKTNEREAREAQRARDEAARLNGVKPSSGNSGASGPTPVLKSRTGGTSNPPPRQATREDRRQQMAQLAAMGVEVPEEFRKENAMAGEWETVAQPAAVPPPPPRSSGTWSGIKKEAPADEADGDVAEGGTAERKRKLGEENQMGDGRGKARRQPNWGRDLKSVQDIGAEQDLDELLAGSSATLARKVKKEEDADEEEREAKAAGPGGMAEHSALVDVKIAVDADTETAENLGSMFKKRKKKT